ncbi:hypothetical protein CDAR_436411, partial [Caerostris darwini]
AHIQNESIRYQTEHNISYTNYYFNNINITTSASASSRRKAVCYPIDYLVLDEFIWPSFIWPSLPHVISPLSLNSGVSSSNKLIV